MFDPRVTKMVETFIEHSKMNAATGVHMVSDIGIEELVSQFDDIPMDERAIIFSGFLVALKDEGINYDTEQFQQECH